MKCPTIRWTLCLSMINTFYKEFRYKLPCPFRGHFRDVLYHFRSKVFENMRLRLICAQLAAQGSGKPEFELRPRHLIKLNEFLDLLDRCNVRFQASSARDRRAGNESGGARDGARTRRGWRAQRRRRRDRRAGNERGGARD